MTTLTDTLRVWASAPDPIDLVVVPVDERDPAALVLGVPALRLVDDAADDRGSSSTTLATNHLLALTGPAAASPRSSSVAGRMSAGLRGVGVAS